MLLSASSCAIWEDRTDCPCWLSIDFSECEGATEKVSVRCFTEGEEQFSDTVRIDPPLASEYEQEVKKGNVSLTYWFGTDVDASQTSNLVSVPYGQQAPPLMAGRSTLFLDGEFGHDCAHVNKQHMTITCDFGSYHGAQGGSMSIVADCNSLDVGTFAPGKGPFSCSMDKISDTPIVYRACLLRQTPDSVIRMAFTSATPSLPSWSFSLGEVLDEMGYDWTEADLRDVYVQVIGKTIQVSVEDMGVYMFEVIY